MFLNLGSQELVIVGVVAVLLFGKRLPEVARSLGGTYREFRKGLSDMQAQMRIDDVPLPSSKSSYHEEDFDDYEQPVAPKFEPPSSEPTVESSEV
jgi:sec-independent protein translocase protein TatA